jgi:hypothetical protein
MNHRLSAKENDYHISVGIPEYHHTPMMNSPINTHPPAADAEMANELLKIAR